MATAHGQNLQVRPATPADETDWVRMRLALWPGDEAMHRAEAKRFFGGDERIETEVLLAIGDDGRAVGFAELSIRNIVDGCEPGRVAYLEGWYVAPDARRRRVGAALIRAAEEWAVAQGCAEFGSDALLDNEVSHQAHRALGFEETDRVINYRKTLNTK
jgi:aminoglycoside 6'-N-acetyltransferase I